MASNDDTTKQNDETLDEDSMRHLAVRVSERRTGMDSLLMDADSTEGLTGGNGEPWAFGNTSNAIGNTRTYSGSSGATERRLRMESMRIDEETEGGVSDGNVEPWAYGTSNIVDTSRTTSGASTEQASSRTSSGASFERADFFDLKEYKEYASKIFTNKSQPDSSEGKRYLEQRKQFREIDQSVNLMESSNSTELEAKRALPVETEPPPKPTILNRFTTIDFEDVFLGESRRDVGNARHHVGDIKVVKKESTSVKIAVLLLRVFFWLHILAWITIGIVAYFFYGTDVWDKKPFVVKQETQEDLPVQMAPPLIADTDPTSSFGQVFDYISQVGISSPEDLSNELSIQYHAIRWLADTDPRSDRMELDYQCIQRYVLAVLAYSTHEDIAADHSMGKLSSLPPSENGAQFTFDRWMTDDHYCKWEGISCYHHHQNGHVTEVSMSNGKLSGQIPKELFSLSKLKKVDLSHNFLEGDFPDISEDKGLKALLLHENLLRGNVPADVCSRHALKSLTVDCEQVTCQCCSNCS